ncbi:MAG: cob(I)yrinic acid a,c-diamide adenosyltransferase [Gemmatimonadota bacterium]|nr:cob(I)yrinic acid a,c-diamide adenosyltransferase [Gemmatimonadota bacterium]
MKIYTRTGDGGETALLGGGRVPKDDARVNAYGQVDELNALLGLVCATEPQQFERALLESVQRDLFSVGGLLASPDPSRVSKALEKTQLTAERVAELERAIDRIESALPALERFILPGGTSKAAYLHVARTVCRRAERSVVALHGHAAVPSEILTYLNRLSDLLFMLARLANYQADVRETIW